MRQFLRWTVVAIVGAAIVVALLAASLPLFGLPVLWRVDSYINPDSPDSRASLVQAQIAATAVLIQVIGSIVILVGIYYTARTLRLNHEGQITDRYSKAIEQLGSEQRAIRLGGIYALERISKDSDRDLPTVIDVLAAFVRENARRVPTSPDTPEVPFQERPSDDPERPPSDIQAALTVIGRRKIIDLSHKDGRLRVPDLRETNLPGAILIDAKLKNASFLRANLDEALMTDADLDYSMFRGASARGASFHGVSMQLGYLGSGNFTRAKFQRANLTGTMATGANFQFAYFSNANLSQVDFLGSDLTGADFSNAIMDDANLERADLRHAKGLTQAQIDVTFMDERTKISDEISDDGTRLRPSKRRRPKRVPIS